MDKVNTQTRTQPESCCDDVWQRRQHDQRVVRRGPDGGGDAVSGRRCPQVCLQSGRLRAGALGRLSGPGHRHVGSVQVRIGDTRTQRTQIHLHHRMQTARGISEERARANT